MFVTSDGEYYLPAEWIERHCAEYLTAAGFTDPAAALARLREGLPVGR
jgi:hypothetical protein